jgi:heme b synthase
MDEKQLATLRMVAWEVTRNCNLDCQHCRARSTTGPYAGELSKEECFKVLDEISSFAKPIIILTGGEPLLRKDIFEIAEYGKNKGLIMVMAPNGTLLTKENVKKIIKSGIRRISVSLDGPNSQIHDSLRRVSGAFDAALSGIEVAKSLGLEFQINSTISKKNAEFLFQMIKLVEKLGAKAYHIFLLVPCGRAEEMRNEELSSGEYEKTLKLLSSYKKRVSSLEIKVTCAPHFNRILVQDNIELSKNLRGRGCMAGVSFCFISHIGELQPCGYLEISCGNVRNKSFKEIWFESEVFNKLRDFSRYKGKCGICEFRFICGGCRARAYAKYADYLREEPYCIYEPKTGKKN